MVDVLCPIPRAIYLQSRSLHWTPLHKFFLNRIPSYKINQNITSFSELRVAQNKLWSTGPILISFPLSHKYTLCIIIQMERNISSKAWSNFLTKWSKWKEYANQTHYTDHTLPLFLLHPSLNETVIHKIRGKFPRNMQTKGHRRHSRIYFKFPSRKGHII